MAKMAKKLTDAVAMATGRAITAEPEINVPAVDTVDSLAEMAQKGFSAVAALCVERNDKADLAANLFQKLNVVQANNVDLREREDYWKGKCDVLADVNSRLQAHLNQARMLFQLISQELHRGNVEIARMRPLQAASNNPELQHVDATGLPVEEPEVHHDENGVEYISGNGAGAIDNEKVQELVATLKNLETRT